MTLLTNDMISITGQCISGALQWEQLFEIAKDIGFCTPVQVEVSPINIEDPNICSLLGTNGLISFKIRHQFTNKNVCIYQ